MKRVKWILFFYFLLATCSIFAWNIGSKGRSTGPAFHTTYFLTPNNQSFTIHATAFLGKWIDSICQPEALLDMGQDELKTGNYVDLDAFALRSRVGMGYTCMTINYFYRQKATETFALFSDGVNYVGSYPYTSEVSIL
ncbi:MAG: hypothetical protein H0W64_06685 [Gammaproteobacteria bacterium]|nr:hypothetical protein [Gammaproteobacteria bacterium]